jgi:hypothetical protein
MMKWRIRPLNPYICTRKNRVTVFMNCNCEIGETNNIYLPLADQDKLMEGENEPLGLFALFF